MSLRKLYSLLLAAAVVVAAASCKDDDDDASQPTLNGLKFECPLFVTPGQHVEMTPKGVVHPEGKIVGYYWKVTPTMSKIDTTRYENGLDTEGPEGKESDGTFEFTFSDTLGTYDVICYAFASGYTGDSYILEVAVVDGGLDRTITGTGIGKNDPKVTVDGIDYYYTTSNGLDWFRNNLADVSSGAAYGNEIAASSVFGRYYTYEEAMTACPDGWRLPTDAEWLMLCGEDPAKMQHKTVGGMASKLFANASFNGEAMLEYWPQVGEITNSLNMAIIPSGFANLGEKSGDGYPYAQFEGIIDYAVVWTADKVEGEEDMAYYRYLVSDKPEFFIGKGETASFGASVRCVRESK